MDLIWASVSVVKFNYKQKKDFQRKAHRIGIACIPNNSGEEKQTIQWRVLTVFPSVCNTGQFYICFRKFLMLSPLSQTYSKHNIDCINASVESHASMEIPVQWDQKEPRVCFSQQPWQNSLIEAFLFFLQNMAPWRKITEISWPLPSVTKVPNLATAAWTAGSSVYLVSRSACVILCFLDWRTLSLWLAAFKLFWYFNVCNPRKCRHSSWET